MEIKFHYSKEDDILTIFTDVAPKETIEFSEFLNIDIDDKKGIVGLEIFYASEFFGKQGSKITKQILENLRDISIEYNDWRNTWFINLNLTDKDNRLFVQKLPPLRKSEYVSPLIASVQ